MSPAIRIAISTCPNDTFAFFAMMERLVDWRGIEFQFELLDIQTLNERLLAGTLDVAKTSFHAALWLADTYGVFPSGSALGFGVGPLLLSARENEVPATESQLTLCPGEHTTASLLFQLFHPRSTRIEQVVFSEIMPALRSGYADFGVCIHEGRFTWQSEGLHLVEDLGTTWESQTSLPLPLGGIVGAWSLGRDTLGKIQAVIRDSIEFALQNRAMPLETMRHYAQEFDDRVLMQHVDLYVNEWTLELGETGQSALDMLSALAARIELTPNRTRLNIIAQ
jgi:1,4-dihydroxy-6-naphthoate synthase